MSTAENVLTEDVAAGDPREQRRNYRAFLIIWASQLVARLGNGLTAFGLGVHVYQETGTTSSVAAVTMAAFLPGVLLTPFAGVLADRFDRRLLMILGDTFSAVGLVLLLVALSTDVASVPVICLCVGLSSVFTSVMDPAYRATIGDLLTPEQYARAGGLVQLAGAAQYLISPAVAGVLMAAWDIGVVVMIDVATMAVTVGCMLLVWRTIRGTTRGGSAQEGATGSFWSEFRFGVTFMARNRAVTVMMLLITLVTFCMGFLVTLQTPMVLDLSDEETLGTIRSVAAVGMLVASIVISAAGLGTRHRAYLAAGLAGGGVAVLAMGTTPNVWAIGVFTFLFFATLPVLNTSVEVLVRAAIPNETQGRVFGLMGLLSQLGYIVAYGISGLLADHVFNPLLTADGALAETAGQWVGVGASRGIGLMFILVGLMLVAIAVVVYRARSIRTIEQEYARQAAAEANKK
ncbi:MFS transporter [Myceligenerans crystallogenes]|uniref:MFS transporter n=1 Tax=Myceligenerans crystallogenes TaxID=316335 RepID=A0ABN2N2G4_9MICO